MKPLKWTKENLKHLISKFTGAQNTFAVQVNTTFDEVYENLEGIDGRVTNLEKASPTAPHVANGVLYL